jgi:DNA-binding transcriptional regulator YdaS (Cro superfamily)
MAILPSVIMDCVTIAESGPRFFLSRSRLSANHRRMTKLLEQAIEAVRRLPADSQDDIARTILRLAGNELEAEPVDPAHLAALLEGLAQATRRQFATDDQVEAAFRRFER